MPARLLYFSAFIEDMRVDALPEDVQKDLGRFVDSKPHHLVPHYGMVVKELLPKADPANLKTARAHVRALPKKKMMNVVQDATRTGKKYVLLLNDRIIDGHHFLAKAEHAGITSSLNVLDLTPTRFQFAMNDSNFPNRRPDQRSRTSHLRTAAHVAAGTGLAYGGVKLGRAAEQVRRTAQVAEAAAENARAISGAIRSPLRSLRKVVRLASLRKDEIRFAGVSVAQDRYRKQIKEADVGRAASAYHRSAATGALLGLALRKRGETKGRAATIGAAGGLVVQAATRQISSATKDNFGERSPGGKKLDALPALAIGAGALVAGRKRIPGLRAVKFSAAGAVENVPGRIFRAAKLKKAVLHGAATAGGITVADGLTSGALPETDQTRSQAAAHGLVKGAIFGTGLAVAEPALLAGLRKVRFERGSRGIASLRKEFHFGGRQQLRDEGNRYIDPLKVASGEATAHVDGQRVELPVQHAQVVRAALNKGQTLHRYGQRTGALLKDAVGVATGAAKTDSRGRPQKREWEKSWFRNAAGTAVTAGALLGHASLMKRNPMYRRKVAGVVRQGKNAANSVVPDLFPMSTGPLIEVDARFIRLDTTAPNWDVRDERGRSARVFAPGSRRRERREKKPHERVSFLRKAAVVGAAATGLAGLAIGHRIGKRATAPVSALLKTAEAPKAWQRPGYKSKKVTVVSKAKFQKAGE